MLMRGTDGVPVQMGLGRNGSEVWRGSYADEAGRFA